MSTDEKERWITLPNGVHCLIEKGKVAKGPDHLIGLTREQLANSREAEITNVQPKSLEADLRNNGGNYMKAAHDYFSREFQGRHVIAKIDGKDSRIAFVGATWVKVRNNMATDPLKAKLVPHIADIIKNGKVTPFVEADHSPFTGFHYFYKRIHAEDRDILAVVDVGKRNDGMYEYNPYSLNHEGFRTFENKVRNIERETGIKITAKDSETYPCCYHGASDHSPVMASNAITKTVPENLEIVHIGFDDGNTMSNIIAFDASSSRQYDANGFLHIDASPLTKEQVVHYLGIEIPRWREHGLDPQKEYWGYRPANEIEKAAGTFDGLPVMLNHHVVTPDTPAKDYQVGHTGTDATWKAPYLQNSLTITDRLGIEGIENGTYRQISAAYRYDPDFTPGVFDGKPYDFVIRNIQGNHVALVRKGRAGPDVIVADSEPEIFMNESNVEAVEVSAAEAIKELASLIAGVHIQDPETGEIKDMTQDEDKNAAIGRLLDVLAQYVPEESIGKLKDELTDLAYSKPTGDDDFNAKEAFKYGENVERDRIERREEPGGKDADPMNVREAVKAGENYERRKLDREHESEGMKKAMDACGLDAESPEFRRAFAEGVKYGEEKMRTEREHLDRLHESEGARHAMDSAELVDRITRNSLEELSRRNRLAEKVMPFIGTFAADSMTTIDVARYAARKLGLKADAGQVVTAVEAYLHNRPVPSSRAMAMDSEPGKKRINQVNKFYGLR